MTCAVCHTTNPADARFCIGCGTPVVTGCPQCGTELADNARFCHRCGYALGSAVNASSGREAISSRFEQYIPRELLDKLEATRGNGGMAGERRIVTILFCDVQGSTAMAEQLDPEDWTEIMNSTFEYLIAPIYRYEGMLARLMGDAIVAFFGAPIAHEDDPRRAILAGLDILQGIERHQQSMMQQWGVGINVRVGINTGLVVVGEVGSDLRVEYTAMGDAVNLAARMEQTAQTGTVQISANTYALVRSLFEFESLGEVQVKGKTQPIAAYRVVRELAAPDTHSRGLESYGLTTPLVGRDDELQQLDAVFNRMLRGHAHVVNIIGEAGVGKSRLVREFFNQVQNDDRPTAMDAEVWRASCSSLGEQPYGAISGLLRHKYGTVLSEPGGSPGERLADSLRARGADEGEITRTVPLVAHLLGLDQKEPQLPVVEPEQLRRQIFLAVQTLLRLHLNKRPLILVVDDLHWADVVSLELLHYLADGLGTARLLMVLIHRPTLAWSTSSSGLGSHTALRLSPLPEEESRHLLAAYFGTEGGSIPNALRDLITSQAGGNPFYTEEIVRTLIEGGTLQLQPDGWACAAEVSSLNVPPTVQGILLARLDRLPAGSLRFIQEAAVLGPKFTESVIRAVCTAPEKVDTYLRHLEQVELLERTLPQSDDVDRLSSEYRFTHALVQEVAYESLLLRRRTSLHRHVAETLQQIFGDSPHRLNELEELGYHYSRSGDKEKGARFLNAAGDQARLLYANEDAARYYRRTIECLTTCSEDDCLYILYSAHECLGDVFGITGQRAQALDHYKCAVVRHEQVSNIPAQARVLRKIGSLMWDSGDRHSAITHYQAGLALFGAGSRDIEVAHLYGEMGRLAFRSGLNKQAIDWVEKALDIAQHPGVQLQDERGAASVTAFAFNTLGVALARESRLDEAVEYVGQSVDVAMQYQLHQAAGKAYINLGVLYTNLDPSHAIETCLKGLELAKKIGDLSLQSWLYANLAGAYCTFTGQCEAEGIQAAQAAIELDRQLGQLDHLAVPLIVLGQIYQCHGDHEASLQYFQEALKLAQETREPQLLFPCYDGLASLYLEAGDTPLAEEYMKLGECICEEAGLNVDSLLMMPFLY